MAEFVRHEACGVCTSSDAKAVYDDESWHCFSCGATSPSEEYKEEKQSTIKVRTTARKKETALSDIKAGKAAIAREDIQEILEDSSPTGRGYRGITDETYAKVGVRHEFDEKTGKVIKQYYPITRGLVAAGYKIRYEPKTFSSVGATGRDCDLFMQRNFQQGGKYVLIVSGECDAMAAYQMLKDYYVGKKMDFEVAVVSGTTGDKSVKQIAAQYKFFETFDNIVVGYDNDASGNETVEDVVKALPKGKTRIMKMTYKDANEYLVAGKESQFVSHFFRSEGYLPEGVVGSGKLYDKMLIQADVEKVPFPPFMQKLDSMIGSIEMSTIGIFAAGTGAAKTTVANELLYYWIFNSPHKIGVVSLELTCAQYGQVLLSRHIGRKISLIKDKEEKLAFLRSDHVKQKVAEVFSDEDGNDRFMVIDEREGSIEILQDQIEELVISCGCKVIILDPVSDLMDGLANDEQAKFAKWCKSMIKNYNIHILMIAHIRKASSNKDSASTGKFIPEEAIMGSSTFMKSASWIVMMQRDKTSEDPIVRNTTHLVLTKNRAGGETGPAGDLYYDNATHTLHDIGDYFQGIAPEAV